MRRLDSRVDESTGEVLQMDDSAFGSAVRTSSRDRAEFFGGDWLPSNLDGLRAGPLKMAPFPVSSRRHSAESVAAIAQLGLRISYCVRL